MKNRTQKIVTSAMLAALVCVATMIIKIPSPLKGYINLGDCIVLLSGWLLSPVYGFLTAAIGSALADLFYGYVTYIPATFVIKGIMAVVANYSYKAISSKAGDTTARITGGILAEIIMVAGYFLFEGILYGFGPSLVNILPNSVQGVAGIIFGILLLKVFLKNKII